MKLLAIFNLAAVFGLECLTCHGRDQGDCEANGRIVVCQEKVKNTKNWNWEPRNSGEEFPIYFKYHKDLEKQGDLRDFNCSVLLTVTQLRHVAQ